MSEANTLTQLEDLFDALVASEESPHAAALDQWIRRYPQFERELTDFVTSWSLMTSATATPPDASDTAEDLLVLRGMSVVQNLLHTRSQLSEQQATFDGLLGAARASGTTLRELAATTHIGEVVLRKLDRRLIAFATIPEEALSAIANALDSSMDTLSRYLQQTPVFASETYYHASKAPTLAAAEDFGLAVRNDPTMTENDRRRWLDTVPH